MNVLKDTLALNYFLIRKNNIETYFHFLCLHYSILNSQIGSSKIIYYMYIRHEIRCINIANARYSRVNNVCKLLIIQGILDFFFSCLWTLICIVQQYLNYCRVRNYNLKFCEIFLSLKANGFQTLCYNVVWSSFIPNIIVY